MGERIQKVLARAGVGSRRQIEAWIREGRIAVNGTAALVGAQIEQRDRVTLDGRPLRVREPDSDTRVMIYHRSARRAPEEGVVEEPLDLSEKLPKRASRRWISISPLPPNDGGIEVLTSDGELAQALMRKLGTLRIEFALRVRGEPTLGQMEHLKSGVFEDGQIEVESVVPAGGEGFNRWLKLITVGGRARDVHRLCSAAGLQMSRILRVAIGPLRMDRGLAREHSEALPARETAQLYELVGLETRVQAPTPPVRKRAPARQSAERREPSRRTPVRREASRQDASRGAPVRRESSRQESPRRDSTRKAAVRSSPTRPERRDGASRPSARREDTRKSPARRVGSRPVAGGARDRTGGPRKGPNRSQRPPAKRR